MCISLTKDDYELLLFLVNNTEVNAPTVTAGTISSSSALQADQAMLEVWNRFTPDGQDEIAADVEHVLSGISQDLAFLL